MDDCNKPVTMTNVTDRMRCARTNATDIIVNNGMTTVTSGPRLGSAWTGSGLPWPGFGFGHFVPGTGSAWGRSASAPGLVGLAWMDVIGPVPLSGYQMLHLDTGEMLVNMTTGSL